MRKFLFVLIMLTPLFAAAQQDTIRMPQATIDRVVATFQVLNDTIKTEQSITFLDAQNVINQVNRGYQSSRLQWYEFIDAKEETVEETISGTKQTVTLIRKDDELYAFVPRLFSLVKWDLINKE